MFGRVAELVDARGLGPRRETCGGSSPLTPTQPLVAQLVEQLALNQTVVGSNPTGGTTSLAPNTRVLGAFVLPTGHIRIQSVEQFLSHIFQYDFSVTPTGLRTLVYF